MAKIFMPPPLSECRSPAWLGVQAGQPPEPFPALGRSFLVQGCESSAHPFVHRAHELVCPSLDALAKALASQRRLAKGEVLAVDAVDGHTTSASSARLAIA